MSDFKSEEHILTSTKTTNKTSASSSDAPYVRQRIVENVRLILVGVDIDQSRENDENMMIKLRSIVNTVDIFTELDECIQFIRNVNVEKIVIIASGYFGQYLVPDIHAMNQLDSIFIVCANKSRHQQWTKEWMKVKGVFTTITDVCQPLKRAVKQCNHDCTSISFATLTKESFNRNLDEFEFSLMYNYIFNQILLEIEQDENSIKNLVNYCRKYYDGNIVQSTMIDEFEHNYRPEASIWWYTRECFIYQMLNRAFRLLEIDTLINMSFFLRNMRQQIKDLHQQQYQNYSGQSLIVYHGQGLSAENFEKLLKTKDGFITFNNFLIARKSPDIALSFAKEAVTKTNTIGILFKLSIDPSISSTLFASIQQVSYDQREEEILLSIHSMFRIETINKMNDEDSLYQVDLTHIANDDPQLQTLMSQVREETAETTGWERLGHILIKFNQFDKAGLLYTVLEHTTNDSKKIFYYNKLGYIYDNQGHYDKAVSCYQRVLENQLNTLPPDHPDLANSYNTIGLVYKKMNEYSKVLQFYEKAFEIHQKILPSNHPLLPTSLNNIGEVYAAMEEYSKALSVYEKALEIYQETLPSNHVSLAMSYNDMGLVYYHMKEYPTALSFYEKALQIRQNTLPSNHPSLATSYNNIAWVFRSMGDNSTALSYYERALDILQSSLPADHPHLQSVLDSIETLKKESENSVS